MDYKKQWEKIDSLIEKKLPKSALEKVNAVYKAAKIEDDNNNFLKSIIYKGRLLNDLEEDGTENLLLSLEKEVEEAMYPSKQILQSVLAQFYFEFGQRSSYRNSNRTEILFEDPEDLRTWSISTFIKKSIELSDASIAHPNLKNVLLIGYPEVVRLIKDSEQESIDNWYDLLIYRAINLYSNKIIGVSQPIQPFSLDQSQYLGELDEFLAFEIPSSDSLSSSYKAISAFQKLLTSLNKSKKSKVLLDLDLRRLAYVSNNSNLESKDSILLATFDEMLKTYEEDAIQTHITYAKANSIYSKGQQYNKEGSPELKWNYKEALKLCDEAINKYPKSNGAKKCKHLKYLIENKNLEVKTEFVVPSKEFNLAQISYRNIEKVYTKLLKLSDDDSNKLQSLNGYPIANFLLDLELIDSKEYNLPDDGDYRQHSVEIKIDPLNFGEYALIVSDSKNFDKKSHLNFIRFTVSNLAYTFSEGGVKGILVVDRKTGQPKENVKVEFHSRIYNAKIRRNEYKLIETGTTNAEGKILGKNILTNYLVTLRHGDDKLESKYSHRLYNRRSAEKNGIIHLFTDRSIYRPGQSIYFKGLVMEYDANRIPSIVPNRSCQIIFYDVNNQKIQSLDLKSNEFGSFHGNFVAPVGLLGGRMRITAQSGISNGSQSIQIEEYKRPKFEVQLAPFKGPFKLDEIVELSGSAKMFAGSSVDNASYRYRVVREVRIPYYYYWRYPQGLQSQEIAHGGGTTDGQGNFKLSFQAIPDKSVSKEDNPVFSYKIEIDVIDGTGETQSATSSVQVAYTDLEISIDLAEELDKSKLDSIRISTTNVNGEKIGAEGSIHFIKLKEPSIVKSHRYWQIPDTNIYSRTEFKTHFPQFQYDKSELMRNLAEESTVFQAAINTENNEMLNLKGKLVPGAYKVKVEANDPFGTPVTLIHFFTLSDFENEKFPKTKHLWIRSNKNIFTANEELTLDLGSGGHNLNVYFEIEKNSKVTNSGWLNITNKESIKDKVSTLDYGNYFVHLTYILNNRIYREHHTVHVPWSHKELDISFETFRDKMLPGSQEEWRLKISGKNKDKIGAELLASMYDASLDKILSHNWTRSFYRNNFMVVSRDASDFKAAYQQRINRVNYNIPAYPGSLNYPDLELSGFYYWQYNLPHYGGEMMSASPKSRKLEAVQIADADMDSRAEPPRTNQPSPPPEGVKGKPVQIRTNLNETVFFYPDLKTDKAGNVILSFKMNEALTKWKLQLLAHNKNLEYAFSQKEVITQKELMVFPNAPRFLRQSDQINFTAKISNLTDQELQGSCSLELFDAVSLKDISGAFNLKEKTVSFSTKEKQSQTVSWKLDVPSDFNGAIGYRIIARAEKHSDGEESILPVLSNKMMVTETLTLPVNGKETKTFVLNSLKESSASAVPHKLTLEFTSNPAWYAVKSLPYLMEYPYDCTEQVFNRYYANALASTVANAHPKIKKVFDSWKSIDPDALKSNLNKNEELKSALLEETPWVLEAQSEEAQMQNIGLLFDLNKMTYEQDKAIQKLIDRQLSNGGFSWFPGGRDSWYITQYLVEGFGHLGKLGVSVNDNSQKISTVLNKAVEYIDSRIVEHYNKLKERYKEDSSWFEKDNLDQMAVHYLYARSFFNEIPLNEKTAKVQDFFLNQCEKYWSKKGLYSQGMIALALFREDKRDISSQIIKSLNERSIVNDELGMYWKGDRGYLWYQLPIEMHALFIEAFSEINNDKESIDLMKKWLLKNKQTMAWKTTKSTSAAVYALLMNGDNWLLEDQLVNIKVGDSTLDPNKLSIEEGSGYFKTSWSEKEINPSMAEIKISNPNKSIAWGGLYYQYFEELNNIKTFEETPLDLKKALYKEVYTDQGPKLITISETEAIEKGDKIVVRIELRVDRPMEFVHMKDMRGSGFEPINVISQYKWQGMLGYYETTKDVATHFFFDYLPKGTHVFQYPLRAVHFGSFSNGISSIQSMYAPEFSSHSEGLKIIINEEKK
jgi:hypothetical protein